MIWWCYAISALWSLWVEAKLLLTSHQQLLLSVFSVIPFRVFLSLNCLCLTFDSFLSDVVVVFSHSSPCHDHGDHSRWPSAPWLHHCPPHLHHSLPPSQCALLVERCLSMLLPLTKTALDCLSFNWLLQATMCLLCGYLMGKKQEAVKVGDMNFTASCVLCVSTNTCFYYSLNEKAIVQICGYYCIKHRTITLDYTWSGRLWPDRQKPQHWRTTVFVVKRFYHCWIQ